MLGDHNDAHILCDDCLNTPRPWTRGRAVFLYNAQARSMISALKRKDRYDLVAPFAHWMLRRGAEIFPPAPGGWSENCLCGSIGPRRETGLIWCAAFRG